MIDPPSTSSVDLQGQSALIVGAASGIGRSAAALLARRGAHVLCADIKEPGVEDLAAELRSDGLTADSLSIDVTSLRSVEEGVAEAEQFAGRRLDVLVNCAGMTGRTGILTHEVEPADFEHVYQINLRGAFLLSRAVLPSMMAHGYGRILHIASIAGKEGNAGMLAYSATKAGLIGLVKSMGKEYAKHGITVNALAPAVIRTAMVEDMPDHQVDYMTARIPMARTGSLQEAAEMIAWIVSPECSFTTGFTFDLSGGRAVY